MWAAAVALAMPFAAARAAGDEFETPPLRTVYDGRDDDLLTAGLGRAGLLAAPAPPDAARLGQQPDAVQCGRQGLGHLGTDLAGQQQGLRRRRRRRATRTW